MSILDKAISVIMPTYNQHEFIRKAFNSLLNQTFTNWELIIINDGSNDETSTIIAGFLKDSRVRHYVNDKNLGLGACLNLGLDLSINNLIAYLPSDDFYFSNHLETLHNLITKNRRNALVFSGIYYPNYSVISNLTRVSKGVISGHPLQLVQVLHRKTDDRWIERDQLVTDDLYQLFWKKLITKGPFLPSHLPTCHWVSHPKQRHKIINAGIWSYRQYYNVGNLINFRSTTGININERKTYPFFKNIDSIKPSSNSLKILLVGELAYNPERILAFEEHGHKLFGLWMDSTQHFNSVGPLPFGSVINIPFDNWIESIKQIQPNIIYAQLGWGAVRFAHTILKKNPGFPFVWHFKESPMFCQVQGLWTELFDLYKLSDGHIFINQESKNWLEKYIPISNDHSFIMDGELPKRDSFTDDYSNLLSEKEGDIHTVLLGRPIGLRPEDVALMAKQGIHLHFYGIYKEAWKDWLLKTQSIAPRHIHVHPNCHPNAWVNEFSKYDAGWLHYFQSENFGEIMRASWNDLNLPARIPPMAAAGLPMLQKDNTGHIVATQSLVQKMEIGICFNTFEDLAEQLLNKNRMSQIRTNMLNNRFKFTFDYHIDELIAFFHKVIANCKQ